MDDDELIRNVSKYRIIWDKNEPHYKNKIMKENAWRSIAIFMDFPVEACEHRWSILRNKYATIKRELKNAPADLGMINLKWPLFGSMNFLAPFVQPRRSYTNMKYNTDNSSIEEESQQPRRFSNLNFEAVTLKSEENVNQEEESYESFSEPQSPPLFQPPQIQMAPKRPIITNVESVEVSAPKKQNIQNEFLPEAMNCFSNFSKLLEKVVESKSTVVHQEELTQNEDFFAKSLAKDLRNFNFSDRIYLKKEIYNLIYQFIKQKERTTNSNQNNFQNDDQLMKEKDISQVLNCSRNYDND